MIKSRPTLIIGNWKMNKTIAEARSFISALSVAVSQSRFQVGLAVPFTLIAVAAETASGTSIAIGAQNVSDYDEGAYTGEISCAMIKDAGASFALVGHSERRHLFHESDALVNRKIKKNLAAGIKPIFCIGETLAEHQSRKTQQVLSHQILEGLKGLTESQIESLTIAYEPVWAIGTQQAASPHIVQETHAFCRYFLAKEWGQKAADLVTLQYGGSVSPANATAFLIEPDVDGLLVGGASLNVDSFNKIVQDRI